jgi:CRP/FNR family transcriptional regulator, nitrogen oxide reductase regulator
VAASGIAIPTIGLKSHFLDGLAQSARDQILGAAAQRRFEADCVVTNQGHSADRLFLLTSGLARLFVITDDGRKLLFRWLGPQDLFGGMSVLTVHSSYLFSTETVTDTSVLVWQRPTIRALIVQHPRLLENALVTASDYLAWHLEAHVGLACHTARQRVAQVLVTLARTVGERARGGIALRITNEELANAANVTAFTASRLMSAWQRNRALIKSRGEVLLLSPERLSWT